MVTDLRSIPWCLKYMRMWTWFFCIKNVFELEGVINSRDFRFEFLNRSVPIYPEKELILKPDEQKLVKVRAPFVD